MNQKIYNYSIKILSKRDYSEKKMIEKIMTKYSDEYECHLVIEKLKKENFLNIQRYQTDKAQTLAKKGFSLQYIQQTFQQEDILLTTDNISTILEKDNIDIELIIKGLLNKKISDYILKKSDLSEQQLVSKAMLYLSSKGYDYYQAIDLLPKELSENID